MQTFMKFLGITLLRMLLCIAKTFTCAAFAMTIIVVIMATAIQEIAVCIGASLVAAIIAFVMFLINQAKRRLSG